MGGIVRLGHARLQDGAHVLQAALGQLRAVHQDAGRRVGVNHAVQIFGPGAVDHGLELRGAVPVIPLTPQAQVVAKAGVGLRHAVEAMLIQLRGAVLLPLPQDQQHHTGRRQRQGTEQGQLFHG